jgi:hypothetical protein
MSETVQIIRLKRVSLVKWGVFHFLENPMLKRILPLLFLLSWALAACAAPQTTATVPGAAPTDQPDRTDQPDLPTLPPPSTAKPVTPTKMVVDASGIMPGCTVQSVDPTPGPTQESLFAPVTDADWQHGPETARVTLIEYSDFQ